MRPPTTCQTVKVRTGVCRAPATGLSMVRTTGMNRASTMALAGPYLTKSSSARTVGDLRPPRSLLEGPARPPSDEEPDLRPEQGAGRSGQQYPRQAQV